MPQSGEPLFGGERLSPGADLLGVRGRIRVHPRALPAVLKPVLTLSDLERWSELGPSLAVIGHPIGHSLSPQMHAAALSELARTDQRFGAWRYHAFDLEAEHLPVALDLMAARGFLGINLTVPHKVRACGLVAAVDPAAREVGAVNTLLREASGWRGFNTDGDGLASGIRQDLGTELGGAHVVLLGAGGAARAAAVECLRAGCAGLWILNRSSQNLGALLDQLTPLAGTIPLHGLKAGTPVRLPEGTLVINATSAGLHPEDPAPVDLGSLEGVSAVYDMIYNPPKTELLAQAERLGLRCAGGLGMLVHQGAKALEIWSGQPASRTAPFMRAAAAKALGSRPR